MKIATIVGARPQFIKASAVSREIKRRSCDDKTLREVLIHTGQHFDANMSKVFFQEMGIPEPKYNLGVGGGPHGAMTGRMIEKLEEVLVKEHPDIVLVYGDTNSTLAGAIAASKMWLNIAHVEAGMRSFNMTMPEEINRILTDRVSKLLFCSTTIAIENLQNECVDSWGNGAEIVLSGDVMQDSAFFYRDLAKPPDGIKVGDGFVLCTIHRAENTDSPDHLGEILSALNEIGSQRPVLLPLHPRTKTLLEKGNLETANITLLPPVGYLNMVWLIDHCQTVITDSGGLQKEAYFFGKPCITLRAETEWVELVENGYNQLAGADRSKIVDVYRNANFNQNFDLDLYGQGSASEVIVGKLLECG